ncbi:TPA: protein transport protein HofC [Yersinia enterocolitica]|uniref:protein transport protein HofC n=1 Tax=Yersinia enterocolitica TaxID=630 RepID=UPI0032FBAC7E|nr:protein transport protein HofC [Yersinia enterocolitica]HDL6983841.1 protein transport protein HofC [Yersinia enterocolitica]HDL7065600.1 protein transport protein HofC [Yersinia enterocolitica]HDL7069985.1 protein transport protein HofC [Yersinia enterocolitica]HDL7469308.1 protein transport protein HofC [Yersinia enterocolitica]
MSYQRLFYWRAINTEGQLQTGALLTTERNTVYEYMLHNGLQPLRVKGGKRLSISYWRGEHLIAITRQLATLLQAGLPLVNCLQLLAQEIDALPWQCLLQEISQQVSQGQSLSEAMAHYPHTFPQLYPPVIAMGELTGNLEQCCMQLVQHQERQQKLQKKVIKALKYPVLVCVVALVVSIVMLVLVLPEFAQIYQSFDTPLPALTATLLFISAFLTAYGPYLIALLTLFCISYIYVRRHQTHCQQWEQKLLLRIPLVSALIRGSCLSQIFQTLAITQHAGLPLTAGLDAALRSINNDAYQQALRSIQKQINQGIPLHVAITQHPLFPPLCQQMVRVGEESGALDVLLGKLAGWQQQQTQDLADNLTQMLEPLLMLIIGSIVGVLVIAMYLPIFQLGDVIG